MVGRERAEWREGARVETLGEKLLPIAEAFTKWLVEKGIPFVIIDSGLDVNHMEFRARPNTTVLNEQQVDLSADEYHGTIVASTAAGSVRWIGGFGSMSWIGGDEYRQGTVDDRGDLQR